jgi:hypothetical protein
MARFDQRFQVAGQQNNAETINVNNSNTGLGWAMAVIAVVLIASVLVLMVVGPQRIASEFRYVSSAFVAATNCKSFPSQAAAQEYLREAPNDPLVLDRERDGIACEGNPTPKDLTPVARS